MNVYLCSLLEMLFDVDFTQMQSAPMTRANFGGLTQIFVFTYLHLLLHATFLAYFDSILFGDQKIISALISGVK